MKSQINKNGYFAFNDTGKLVHRWVAYHKIYLHNPAKYPFRFGYYQIHHIDRNKLNNNPENLALMLKPEHRKEHGIPSFCERLRRAIFG